MDTLTEYILSHLDEKTLSWLLGTNEQREKFLSRESEWAIREVLAQRKSEEV